MTHQPPYLPWYLDACNGREIIVKDSRGNIVHYDDLAFPSEWGGSRISEVVIELRANAMAMVEWSEKANLSENPNANHLAAPLSQNSDSSSVSVERDKKDVGEVGI